MTRLTAGWHFVTTETILAVISVLSCAAVNAQIYPQEDKATNWIFIEPGARATLRAGVRWRDLSQNDLSVTKMAERYIGRLYNDAAGFCTIGYGHLVGPPHSCNGTEGEEFRRGLSEPQSAGLLLKDMKPAQISVLNALTINPTHGQFAALCDFVYNVGASHFEQSTLLSVINARDFDSVPKQFRRWTIAGGRELPGLKARREREIAIFFEGLPVPKALAPENETLPNVDISVGEVGSR